MPETIEFKVDGDAKLTADYPLEIEYYESLDALDALTIRFDVPNQDDYVKVAKKLVAGAPFALTLDDRTIEGDITRVTYTGGTTRPFGFTVFGLEHLHRLRNLRFSEIKEQAPDAVAKTLIGEVSKLSAKTQSVDATAEELIYLDDQMLALLKRLADERNFALRCDGTELHFSPRNQAASGKVELDWETDVVDADINTDISEVVTSVKVLGRDYVKDQDVDYKASSSDIKGITSGTSAIDARKKKIGATDLQINHTLSTGTSSEVKELAIGELQRRAETFLSGVVVSRDQTDAQVGQKLTFKNGPWPFEGPFLISGIIQTYVGGELKTTIEFFSDGITTAS